MTRLFDPVQYALLALCGALSLMLAYQLAAPIAAFEAPTIGYPHKLPVFASGGPVSAPSSASLDDINARPLFSPLRKPIASQADAAKAGAPQPFPTDLSLVGIIIEGSTRMALVRTAGSVFAASTSVGAEVEGWQVVQIVPDRIVLQSGTATHEVLLASNRAPPQSASAAAGTAAPQEDTQGSIGPKPAPTSVSQPSTSPQQ